jgi:hypothetical protein
MAFLRLQALPDARRVFVKHRPERLTHAGNVVPIGLVHDVRDSWDIGSSCRSDAGLVHDQPPKVAAAGASLDVPLGHKDDSWSFPHFDTITVSVADAPRPSEILVVMAIADRGRLQNRCGTEPIR